MPNPEPHALHYFFSLPRLIATLLGHTVERSERNWLEANVAGTAIHVVVFVFVAHRFLDSLAWWHQALLLLPLAVVVWLLWLILFYVNSLAIRGLRAVGLFRRRTDARAQGFLVCLMTTACATGLVVTGSWMRLLGILWIALVVANLLAAGLLAASRHADGTNTK